MLGSSRTADFRGACACGCDGLEPADLIEPVLVELPDLLVVGFGAAVPSQPVPLFRVFHGPARKLDLDGHQIFDYDV
jgi:hypothetical protein